jgi:hypothetical protein
MDPSKNESLIEYKQYIILSNTLEFVFNNGDGKWQQGPSGENFKVQFSGIYAIKGEVLTIIKIFGKGFFLDI